MLAPMNDPVPSPRTLLLVAAGTFLLVLLAFGRSLFQGFSLIDDPFLVVYNLAAQRLSGESIRLAFTTYDPELYIPLTLLSFQFNTVLTGMQPLFFHLVSLLLHTVNALLLMALLFQMSGSRFSAIFAGLLFSVHPLHTETVVWIAARKDLLMSCFFLLSLLAYLRSRERPDAAYAASILFFLLSLLSKVTALTLPVILLLLELLGAWHRPWRTILLRLTPFATLSVVFALVAIGGKSQILSHVAPLEALLMAGRSVFFYLEKLLLPVRLSFMYPYEGEISAARPDLLFGGLLLFLLSGVAAFLWRRARVWSFAILFFLLTVSPTFLHYRRFGMVFLAVDHYAYLPSVGFFLFLALLFSWWLRHGKARWRAMCWISATFLVLLGVTLSVYQTTFWDSSERLYTNILRLYPRAVKARVLFANELRENGEYKASLDLLREGLRFGDDAQLHLYAGYIYADMHDAAKTREQLNLAHRLSPADPDILFALGQYEEQMGRIDQAKQLYVAAIARDGMFPSPRIFLAHILRMEGDLAGAETQLREVLRRFPSCIDAHLEYALLCREDGRLAEAEQHLDTILRVDPRYEEARRIFREGSDATVKDEEDGRG